MTQQYAKRNRDDCSRDHTGCRERGSILTSLLFSCFEDDNIRKNISVRKKTVLVCGIEAHICVLQTCIDLKTIGYTRFL